MFWVLIYLSLAAGVIVGIVGQIKEKGTRDAEGAWFGWGLCGLLAGLLVTAIISFVVGMVTYTAELGPERVTGSHTYKIAENSRLEVSGHSLEFTYTDDTGHLAEFDGYADSIKFESTKGQTVEVIDYQTVATGILPWDIINEGKKAVVK